MNSLTFHTNKELTRADLLAFGQTGLNVSQIEWSDDSIDRIPGSTSPITAYVLNYISAGQFPFQYEIYLANLDHPITHRKEVDFLLQLARQFQLEALKPTEDINPYSFIHILPNGEAIEVDIDTEADRRDELTIGSYYPLSLGGFSTEAILSEVEIGVLRELLNPVLNEFELVHYSVEEMNNEFTHNRAKHEALRDYNHCYIIRPLGKNLWRSQDEKSELLLTIMTSFYRQTSNRVCIFPSNSTRYANISGGSDHESFCINIDEKGAEKIVYKELRKSWS